MAEVARVGIHPRATGRSAQKAGQPTARGPSTEGSDSLPRLVPYEMGEFTEGSDNNSMSPRRGSAVTRPTVRPPSPPPHKPTPPPPRMKR